MRNFAICVLLVLFASSCSVVFYGRIGDQELKDIEIKVKSQRADPNLPAGFIGTLAEILEML